MKWCAIYPNLPVNAIVRLPHTQSEDSHGRETLLAPSADKQTCNYDRRVLNSPSLPKNTKVKLIEPYIQILPVHAIVILPHPWSEDSQGQKTF